MATQSIDKLVGLHFADIVKVCKKIPHSKRRVHGKVRQLGIICYVSNKGTYKSCSFVLFAIKGARNSMEQSTTFHSEAQRMEPYDLQVETFVRLPSVIKSNRRDGKKGGGRSENIKQRLN